MPKLVTGRGDGHAFLHGIKVSFLFEFLAEFPTTCFEEFDVQFAVGFHLSSHDKVVVGSRFFGIPSFEFDFLFGRHTIGIVVGDVEHGTLEILMFKGVEFMQEESLTQFFNPEGGWKFAQREREEA